MGGDGHITIWNSEKVRAAWPDADRLFRCLPNHYQHSLEGRTYDHCYEATSYSSWGDEDDWYVDYVEDDPEKRPALLERVRAFVEWLDENADGRWEVWN